MARPRPRTRARRGRTARIVSHPPVRPQRNSSGLDNLSDAAITARRQIAAGAITDAVTLLAQHLAGRDYAWQPADPAMVDATTLYALHTTGPEQLAAARYAYHGSRRLHPRQPHHPRRLDAAHAYGLALHQHTHFEQAIQIRRNLLATYHRLRCPAGILATVTGLAESLHAAGRCPEALRAIAWVWHIHDRNIIQNNPSTGAAVLGTYLRMLRGCRRDRDLTALLHQAQHHPAWSLLVAARSPALDAADHRAVTAHRSGVCTHTPQPMTAITTLPPPPPACSPTTVGPRDAPPRRARAAGRRTPAAGRDTSRHPLAGYPTSDIAGAVGRLLTAPEAQPLLPPARTPHPDDLAAHQHLTGRLTAYLAHRRALRVAMYTAAVAALTTVVVVAILLR
ncbi:hypothetical protein ACTOB_003764 [Actinoplanes oblitus]|uniref:Uncharacterized protein n=1 Tax=Actinoplanes oblitus TaxID=3040509 RepID=A0ABY8WRK0_9ACTN|nr:hypothetical protein [Actinoplanes oblitus]WIN00083.1 hypothetical protein ACTOB_003764 [Actinoplanes oblitus]